MPEGRIRVEYTAVDAARETKTFNDLDEARAFANGWIGKHPEIGSDYAVSGDGVGKITANVPMSDLFPEDT